MTTLALPIANPCPRCAQGTLIRTWGDELVCTLCARPATPAVVPFKKRLDSAPSWADTKMRYHFLRDGGCSVQAAALEVGVGAKVASRWEGRR